MKCMHVLLLLLISLPLFSQKKAQTVADSLFDIGNIEEAIPLFRADNKYIDLAKCYALTRKRDSAFHYLKLEIPQDSSVRILNNPHFYNLIEDDRWMEIENALVKNVEAKHGPYEKPELSKELWRMNIKDQAFYYHIFLAEKQVGEDSPIVDGLWQLKSKINAENENRIMEIIDTHGWPKKSVVKGSAASTVFLIIQHADIEIQKKYLPIMRKAADEKEASWSQLAMLIDRVNLREGKQQIYGTQVGKMPDGSMGFNDLKDPEYVNQRRKEVGLRPIEEYAKYFDIEWTIPQKTK